MIRFTRYAALLGILGGFLGILAGGCEGEQYETPPGAPDL